MKLLSRIAGIGLLLAAVTPVYPQQAPRELDPWLIRAQSITTALLEDMKQLASPDRALLWARLGVAWFKDDPDRARLWLVNAVAEIEAAPDHETGVDRRRRLATARSLLAIIASRDKKLEGRVLAVLETRSDSATDGDRRDNANAVADNALAVVDSNPARAAQLGSEALRIGLGYRLAQLLWQLRKRDPQLSDALFDQALAVARVTYDPEALGWLAGFAFRGPTPADERKARLLGVLAEGILRLSPAAGSDEKACGLGPTAAPLLEQFSRLLPQQAPLVRAAVIRCQTNGNASQAGTVDREQLPKTVDELVKASDDAPDRKTRDNLLLRAAELANQEKAFERAVALLDRVSDDERKESGAWEGWRWSYASAGAIAQLKRGNEAGMQRIIAATPSSLRPFVQLSVASELLTSGNRASAIELLQAARSGMVGASARFRNDGYVGLVRRYVELDPASAVEVLKEAVKAFNSDQSAEDNQDLGLYARVNLLSNDMLLQLFKLPEQLFELDDIGVRETLSSIKLPIKRAAVNLNLLSACLAQHRSLASPDAKLTAKQKRDVAQ